MPSATSLVTVGSLGAKVAFTWTNGQTALYSGVLAVEASGFKSWTFNVIGGATVTSITVFGTIDAAAVNYNPYVTPGADLPNPTYPAPGVAGGNWFALNPGALSATPADVVNPFTKADGSQYLFVSGYPLVGICGVSGGTQTGVSTLLIYATQ